jgi:N-acetylmuramoyl-L-alanine amidase
MSKVFIGVGHGGSDPGATANGLIEADMNLVMALALKGELDRHGVLTAISRTQDEDDPLSEEIEEANAFQPDLAIDCHNNAGGGDGFEVFYQTNIYAEQSFLLAQAIEAEVKKIGQNSRGCKTKLNSNGEDYFGFLRQIQCPSVICEAVFIDSDDRLIADTPEKQQLFGVAYAKGILNTLGIEYREEENMEASKVTVLNLDNNYEFEVDGFMKEDTNYVAIRGILEPLGYIVGWQDNKVTIQR